MKPWQSVSIRLTLTLLSVTFVKSDRIVLDFGHSSLSDFYIQDAQASLQQQANALATQARFQWREIRNISQLADQPAGKVRVIIFNSIE